MKASELRIGNYHLYKIVNVIGEEYWELCKTDIHDLIFLDKKECTDYAPIPITEEWLLKLGFGEFIDFGYETGVFDKFPLSIGFSYCMNNKKVMIMHKGNSTSHWIMKEILHVHQLQNLYFALTGKELTTS